MFNNTVPHTFRPFPNDSDPSYPSSGTHLVEGSEGPFFGAAPMRELGDFIFDNDRFGQDPPLFLEDTTNLHPTSAIHALYSGTSFGYELFPTTDDYLHQDMGRSLLSDPLYQMANTGVDNEPTWFGPICAPDYGGCCPSGLLSNHSEDDPVPNFTGSDAGDGETTQEPRVTNVTLAAVDETDPPPTAGMIKIPQRKYSLAQKSFQQRPTVTFSCKGVPGFSLQRAYNRSFAGLDGRDSLVLENANGPVTCRLLFPGYRGIKSTQIAAKNWKKKPSPITKSKLAHEVAKRVHKYLTDSADVPIDPSTGLRWTIGQGYMKLENMYLTKISWVSQGSVQPEIWVDTRNS